MDTDFKEYEVVTLEDGKEYCIIDEIEKKGKKYVYLALENDPQSFRIRKSMIKDNEDFLAGLETDEEFDEAMNIFTEKHIGDL